MKKNRSNEVDFVPVRKVLDIVNSCETEQQLRSCQRMICNYVKLLKSQGVINSGLVKKRLLKEYKQKKFQITMIGEYVSEYHKEHFKISAEHLVNSYYRA